MTSSPKPPTWKRWLSSIWIPLSAFLILILASGFVGLSDDESYYWVLAQKPALGYAYHPPMVAWMIASAQFVLGPVFGPSSAIVVRFWSCFAMGLMIFLSLDWMKRAGVPDRRRFPCALALASFAGLFGLGWMMVPDIPLFLGLILAFHSAWRIGYEKKESPWSYLWLGIAMVFAVLGKYSGILIPLSAVAAVWIGPFRKGRFWKAMAVVSLGTALALVPVVIWNSQHEWQSVLYQIHGRHEGESLSLKRYLRFWLIEILATGPVLLLYCLWLIKRAFSRGETEKKLLRFVAAWMIPPGVVYCTQPLFADFKPHWAFIVWFPGALAFAWEVGKRTARFARVQIAYGLALVVFVLASMHVPLMGLAIRHFKGSDYDPRLDVTNDLYGWERFAQFMSTRRGADGRLPYVTASRYQTASQAMAALARIGGAADEGKDGVADRVSLIPRGLKARDEWPMIPATAGFGPDWPKLNEPVYYVGDNRYDEPPQFPSSTCIELTTLDTFRSASSGEAVLLAKRIIVWECKPI